MRFAAYARGVMAGTIAGVCSASLDLPALAVVFLFALLLCGAWAYAPLDRREVVDV